MPGLKPKYPNVAIEIGEGYATAVVVQRGKGRRPKVLSWHSTELPQLSVESDGFGSEYTLMEELRPAMVELVEPLGKVRSISLSLPDTVVKSFFIEIENPSSSNKELQEMIMFKIRKFASVSLDHTALAYQKLEEQHNGAGNYLALLTSRKLISSYESFFQKRGTHLGLVETASLAAANLFVPAIVETQPDSSDFALVRVEDSYFTISLFKDGKLNFNRTRISVQADDLPGEVSHELRTLNLYAQDRLGSPGILSAFVYGPGAQLSSTIELMAASDVPAHRLMLEDQFNVPGDLVNRPELQGRLIAALGSAMRCNT